jgi:KDO2-lipid IV(A) lauroyltransferase
MNARFVWPQYWPTWLALALMRRLARRDYAALLNFGQRLGDFARYLPLPQKSVVRRNLELALPELSIKEREQLLKAHFREAGITLVETAITWFADDQRIRSLAQIEGLEHFDAAVAEGRGVIVLAAHFTTLEIGARFLTATREVHAVYKPSSNALLSELFKRYRGPCAAGMIPSDDIRSMVRVLKRGGAVWYAPDQAYRGKGAERVEFFGHLVATNTATTRLVKMTGAKVLPYFVERLPGVLGYRVRIGAPLKDFPGNSSLEDARRHHFLIEEEIRKNPSQYLWLHKRFKDIPGGDINYYR